jgi:predicted nucleotidyltransferase
VRLAIAFGSRLRGHGRPDSDLDLAVLAPDADLLGLRTDLSRATGVEVDVVSLAEPTIPLLEAVLRDGKVIYEAAPGVAASFRFHALNELELDRPRFVRMRDAWLKRVAERGLGDR